VGARVLRGAGLGCWCKDALCECGWEGAMDGPQHYKTEMPECECDCSQTGGKGY
jgi:hypothetical protein